MARPSAQGDLFAAAPALPDGLAYRPDFVTAAEDIIGLSGARAPADTDI